MLAIILNTKQYQSNLRITFFSAHGKLSAFAFNALPKSRRFLPIPEIGDIGEIEVTERSQRLTANSFTLNGSHNHRSSYTRITLVASFCEVIDLCSIDGNLMHAEEEEFALILNFLKDIEITTSFKEELKLFTLALAHLSNLLGITDYDFNRIIPSTKILDEILINLMDFSGKTFRSYYALQKMLRECLT